MRLYPFGQYLHINTLDVMKGSGIRHVPTASYHPTYNGLAERAVQLFIKAGMRKHSSGSLKTKLAKFLLNYLTTPPYNHWSGTSATIDGAKADDFPRQAVLGCYNRRVTMTSMLHTVHVQGGVFIRNYANGPF